MPPTLTRLPFRLYFLNSAVFFILFWSPITSAPCAMFNSRKCNEWWAQYLPHPQIPHHPSEICISLPSALFYSVMFYCILFYCVVPYSVLFFISDYCIQWYSNIFSSMLLHVCVLLRLLYNIVSCSDVSLLLCSMLLCLFMILKPFFFSFLLMSSVQNLSILTLWNS